MGGAGSIFSGSEVPARRSRQIDASGYCRHWLRIPVIARLADQPDDIDPGTSDVVRHSAELRRTAPAEIQDRAASCFYSDVPRVSGSLLTKKFLVKIHIFYDSSW